MRPILLIAGREVRSVFKSTIGGLILAAFLLLNGVFFLLWLDYFARASAEFSGGVYGDVQLHLSEQLFAPFYGNVATILLMVCPALSMRLFAEERSKKTLELLLTSPVTTTQIVLGKFFGAMAVVVVLIAALAYAPLLLWWWSTPDLGSLFTAHIALLLVGGSALAIGCFFSAVTDNQITALVLTVAVGLALYIVGAAGSPDSVAGQISIINHIDDLLLGGIQLSDLVYFAGLIGIFLFATHQRVESFRWS